MSNNKRKRETDLVEDVANQTMDEWGSFVRDKESLRQEIISDLRSSGSNNQEELEGKAICVVRKLLRQDIHRQNEQLSRQNEQIRHHMMYTIDRLLRLHNASEGDDRDLKAQLASFRIVKSNESSGSSHIDTGRKQAAISCTPFEVDGISFRDQDIDTLPSAILSNQQPWPKKYTGEADVQKFVALLLDDALTYVNWFLKKCLPRDSEMPTLIARPEASLFSNKPDHIVVFDESTLVPVLNVEVKKEHRLVFESGSVNGQMLDYIMLGKLIHGHYSFGVLTTFNESKLAWVDEQRCNTEASRTGRLSAKNLSQLTEVLAKNMGKMKVTNPSYDSASLCAEEQTIGTPLNPVPEPVVEAPKSRFPPEIVEEALTSGSRLEIKSSTQTSEGTRRATQPGRSTSSRPIRQTTETYKPHQLFTVLCNAIVASLRMGQKKLQIHKNFEQNGVVSKDDCVLRLSNTKERKKGHEWCFLEQDYRMKGLWHFDDNQEEIYVADLVGTGDTSRVWRAFVKAEEDGYGYACILKYWIKVYDPHTNKTWSSDKIDSESEGATAREVENYHLIYTEWKMFVGRKRLNARWCVCLPFFEPVDRNHETLKKVSQILEERFYKNGKSYQFAGSDRRWRHVGQFREDTVLFDLAGLKIVEATKEDHSKYVTSHIEELRRRM